MRVLFLHFGKLHVNSVIQAFHLGEEMTAQGIEVVICGQGPTDRIAAVGEPSFDCINYEGLGRKLRDWAGDPAETIVCAWTPREVVRKATELAAATLGAPYVVHLEDNEEHLISSALKLPYEQLRSLPRERQDELCTDDFIHPAHYPRLLEGAAAVTVITDELNEFNLARRPHQLAPPGVDHERFRPDLPPAISREQLGLHPDDFVLVYHGIGHWANLRELFSLYLAVKLLQRRGRPVKLVRLGSTKLGGIDPRSFQTLRDGVPDLGDVPWREIPGYLALADAYVQPGAPDEFNRYRLPSKLPEFLAMGRPLILPACNLGNELADGEQALLLREGTALEISAHVEQLLDDRDLAGRLGHAARQFALDRLSWPENASRLADFYRQRLADQPGGGVSVFPTDRLWELDELYRGRFEVDQLSYGTVRDFADSIDHLGELAGASSDMKDLQRCWMVKAVLGNVERGGRLVEIGAGEPLVADLLTRLGYEVTIVDPYDGSGNGPQRFDEFRSSYPEIDFIRERFPPSDVLPGDVAGVYSISVLEHIPAESVGAVVATAKEALSPGGCAIHAIDHVVAGWGADAHLERLQEIVSRSGLPAERLHELIERLEADPETYFVSAEAHERWRGALPYEDYPMRRIASIGLLSSK